MNKAKKIFLAVLLLSFYNSVFASPFPPFLYDYYFFAENEEYLLLHHYAFKRLKNTEQLSSKNPFTDKDNHYSYFLLIRKKDGAVVLKKSSRVARTTDNHVIKLTERLGLFIEKFIVLWMDLSNVGLYELNERMR